MSPDSGYLSKTVINIFINIYLITYYIFCGTFINIFVNIYLLCYHIGMNFSDILKEKSKNKSPYDLAEEYGVSHTTIYKIINGEMDNPSALLAARLCAMLDINPKTLHDFDFHPDEAYIRKVEEKIEVAKDKELFDKEVQSLIIDRVAYITAQNKIARYRSYHSRNIGIMDFGNLGITYVVLHENKVKEETVIEFHLPVRHISSKSGLYDNKILGDFLTIMMALLSDQSFVVERRIGNPLSQVTISNSDNKSSITKSVKNFVFSTTSKLLYDELCKYTIKDMDKYNISLFYRYKNSYDGEAKALMGERIIGVGDLFLQNIAK